MLQTLLLNKKNPVVSKRLLFFCSVFAGKNLQFACSSGSDRDVGENYTHWGALQSSVDRAYNSPLDQHEKGNTTMLTEQQLENRKKGLGGSEVATILGLNPWKTSYELWLEKTGRVEPEDISGKFAIRRGNDMEDLVAKWFSEDTGLTVHRVNNTLTNDDHPYLVAHIDRRIVGAKEGLECKTANWRSAAKFGESGTDDVPANYLIQCMHYMLVTGWKVWHLAAELGGDFRIYRIEYDPALGSHIAKTANDWWTRHILEDIAPEPTAARDFDLAYPRSNERSIEASDHALALHRELHEITEDRKKLEERETALKNQIKGIIGDNSTLVKGAWKLASWKSQTRRSFDSKSFAKDHPELFAQYMREYDFRVLRVNKPSNYKLENAS